MNEIERLKKDNLLLNKMLTEVSTDCINYKQKLEKIKEYLDDIDVPDHGYPWHIAIREILNSQEKE